MQIFICLIQKTYISKIVGGGCSTTSHHQQQSAPPQGGQDYFVPESFLKSHLVTAKVSCSYFSETFAVLPRKT